MNEWGSSVGGTSTYKKNYSKALKYFKIALLWLVKAIQRFFNPIITPYKEIIMSQTNQQSISPLLQAITLMAQAKSQDPLQSKANENYQQFDIIIELMESSLMASMAESQRWQEWLKAAKEQSPDIAMIPLEAEFEVIMKDRQKHNESVGKMISQFKLQIARQKEGLSQVFSSTFGEINPELKTAFSDADQAVSALPEASQKALEEQFVQILASQMRATAESDPALNPAKHATRDKVIQMMAHRIESQNIASSAPPAASVNFNKGPEADAPAASQANASANSAAGNKEPEEVSLSDIFKFDDKTLKSIEEIIPVSAIAKGLRQVAEQAGDAFKATKEKVTEKVGQNEKIAEAVQQVKKTVAVESAKIVTKEAISQVIDQASATAHGVIDQASVRIKKETANLVHDLGGKLTSGFSSIISNLEKRRTDKEGVDPKETKETKPEDSSGTPKF